jgi:hypothetical protein
MFFQCVELNTSTLPLKGNNMKLFFASRSKARTFASTTARSTVDVGAAAPEGRRWAVDVSKTPSAKKGFAPTVAANDFNGNVPVAA